MFYPRVPLAQTVYDKIREASLGSLCVEEVQRWVDDWVVCCAIGQSPPPTHGNSHTWTNERVAAVLRYVFLKWDTQRLATIIASLEGDGHDMRPALDKIINAALDDEGLFPS